MKASVIIITKNQKSYLEQTLPILLKQEPRGAYEIIVVDSGSTDGALAYIQSLPVTLVQIHPITFNYANAFNSGAQQATGEFLVRLSGDCIPQGDTCLQELLKPFSDPSVGATYGMYTISGRNNYDYPAYWPASRFPKEITRYTSKQRFLMGIIETGKEKEALYNLAGGFCAVRKAIWDQKPFNEKLLEGEDAEYAWFLHLLGYDIVYTPHAQAIHEHEKDRHIQKTGLYKYWGVFFTIELIKYWLLHLLFIDPYKNFKLAK